MVKIFLTLTIFAVLLSGGYYYFIARGDNGLDKASVSNFLAKLNFLEKLEISKKSEEIGKTAQDIKVKTEDIFAGISKSFSATVNKVSSTVSLFDDEVKNNELEQFISSVGVSSNDDSSLGNKNEYSVCTNFRLNEPISYSIQSPSGLTGASSYFIDWGDGGSENNIFVTGTAQVSHIYATAGEFITKFKVESNEYSAEVLKKVCIK